MIDLQKKNDNIFPGKQSTQIKHQNKDNYHFRDIYIFQLGAASLLH
jgi:hypothetical protein